MVEFVLYKGRLGVLVDLADDVAEVAYLDPTGEVSVIVDLSSITLVDSASVAWAAERRSRMQAATPATPAADASTRGAPSSASVGSEDLSDELLAAGLGFSPRSAFVVVGDLSATPRTLLRLARKILDDGGTPNLVELMYQARDQEKP